MSTTSAVQATDFYTWGNCQRAWFNMTADWDNSTPLAMPVSIDINTAYYDWQSVTYMWQEAVITWDGAGTAHINAAINERATLLNGNHYSVQKPLSEKALKITQANNYTIAKLATENVALTSANTAGIIYQRFWGEKLFVDEKNASCAAKAIEENMIVINDEVFKANTKLNDEKLQIGLYNTNVTEFHFVSDEAIKIKVTENDLVNKAVNELLKVAQRNSKTLNTFKIETTRLSEKHIEGFKINREYCEKIFLRDKNSKKMIAVKNESVLSYDAFIEACRGVLSNIAISEGAISVDEFRTSVNSPPGYSSFTDFIVGEYEYQQALVRIYVEAANEQTQPAVNGVIMHVDIPDTNDRGNVQITNTDTATKVYFNKHYYTAPEVVVTLRGGNAGDGLVVPNIVSTDKKDENGDRYFEVELLKSDGQRAAGLIVWQAVGY